MPRNTGRPRDDGLVGEIRAVQVESSNIVDNRAEDLASLMRADPTYHTFDDMPATGTIPSRYDMDARERVEVSADYHADREIRAINLVTEAIRYLPRDAKRRVLAYLIDRYTSPREATTEESEWEG